MRPEETPDALDFTTGATGAARRAAIMNRANVSGRHNNARDSDMTRLSLICWQIEQMARRVDAEEQAAQVRDVIVNLMAWSAVFGAGFWIGLTLLA